MFERFTDRARRVVVLAQEEARLLDHNYIGTEHLLLGLVREGEGVAGQVLDSLGVSLDQARSSVRKRIGPSASTPVSHIPFTPRAKTVLELSLREALELGHNYIGTEHILLGLAREGEGVATLTLAELGVELGTVRAAVLALLGGTRPREEDPRPEGQHAVRPAPPLCPGCFRSLLDSSAYRVITAPMEEAGGEERRVVVAYCRNCGRTFGAFPE